MQGAIELEVDERQWGRGQTAAERAQRTFAGFPKLASMGPRPNGRGKVMRQRLNWSTKRRQWGRGQTAAERLLAFRRSTANTRRQWGRGQTAAESAILGMGILLTASRQWGRGQTAAESRRPLWPTASRRSVNGAAAKRPRKGGVDGPQAGAPRRVNGAAAKRPRKELTRASERIKAGSASMGPRPNGRGKALADLDDEGDPSRQWGRGQTAAER